MPTPAEEAFAEGLSELSAGHGKTWTFGNVSFVGWVSALRPDDPRLQGSADRLLEIETVTASLPSRMPKRGNEIASGGVVYRLNRNPDRDVATGKTILLVSVIS